MLNKELKDKLKQELIKIAILFIIIIIILKILFYKESFTSILRISVSLFWLLIVPGFALLYHYHEKLNFLERLIISIPLSAAIIGIPSYYIGLIGLHVKYHGLILPIVVLIFASLLFLKKNKPQQPSAE